MTQTLQSVLHDFSFLELPFEEKQRVIRVLVAAGGLRPIDMARLARDAMRAAGVRPPFGENVKLHADREVAPFLAAVENVVIATFVGMGFRPEDWGGCSVGLRGGFSDRRLVFKFRVRPMNVDVGQGEVEWSFVRWRWRLPDWLTAHYGLLEDD